MRGLSAQELLRIWEVALRQHPVDRALTILAVALPEVPRDELLALSVGQRDARLLSVRERTFGPQLAAFAECSACQERLEFVFDVTDIRVTPEIEGPTNQVQEVTLAGYDLRFRLPNSVDLAQIVRCRDVVSARNLLVQRCILHVSQDDGETSVTDLPETVIAALAEYMTECDQQAEIQLNFTCPTCGQSWSVMFDIVSFFWMEICAQAKRLLREVHTLARAYGWCEADILSMSTARRQFYLEMVT
jgi:hypothetical protein